MFLASLIVPLSMGAILVVYTDPFFHYHKPIEGLSYCLDDERYINDGIERHFSYDAIITGTSMAANFKASEFDSLFQTHSIKAPFYGEYYKAVNDNLERAVGYNPDIRIILRGLDYNLLAKGKDELSLAPDSYPTYLYDNDPFNDVNYVFNKTVLLKHVLKTLIRSAQKAAPTTFDEYRNWNDSYTFGKEAILETYQRPGRSAPEVLPVLDAESIRQNILDLAEQNPQIDFYLFFTPYSIFYWDQINQEGTLEAQLTMERAAIEMLLPCENIHLYSFFDEFDLICNADNYKDPGHYSEDVNSYILLCMADGRHELTMENYEAYCQRVWDFYTAFDYDLLYQ